MNWSPQQERALAQVSAWMRNSSSQVFCLFGYAGVGKTTLAKHFADSHPRRTLYASYTGKASHVLRTKGCDGATTIHSLIYRPAGETKAHEIALLEQRAFSLSARMSDMELGSDKHLEAERALEGLQRQLRQLQSESEPRFALWANSPLADPSVDLLVVDEVSMVDRQIAEDLESFGKKLLVLGDPAQLPPVGSGGYYTNREPDALLTEVHRHARESGILRLATLVREGGDIRQFESTDDCRVVEDADLLEQERQQIMLGADQVLVGRNATRRQFNHSIRNLLGKRQLLEPGDRMVCLKNDRGLGVYNGSQWRVRAVDEIDPTEKTATLTMTSEDDPTMIVAPIWLHHVLDAKTELEAMGWDRGDRAEFDYGSALTVHKSQGSQWNSVALCDESSAFRGNARRWLYTGVTRASSRLTVIL